MVVFVSFLKYFNFFYLNYTKIFLLIVQSDGGYRDSFMDTINICYSADAAYSEQLCVSVASVLKNADKKDKLNFYILDGGLSEDNRNSLLSLKSIRPFSVNFVKVNPSDFVTCPLLKDKGEEYSSYHVTIPTYFKFKICEYFPELEKILYLDCDVIVRTSLKPLFGIDLDGFSALMVKDAESDKESQRLNLPSYFNAGVMLINLRYWYENDIPSKLFNCAIERKDDIVWQDQDILNIVLSGSVREFSSLWNYQYFIYKEENIREFSECYILHYAGMYKPWLRPFSHAVYDVYYGYLALTPYKNREIVYRKEAFGKFLTSNFKDKKIVVGEIASGFDIQSVFDEISNSYKKIDELSNALEDCYKFASQTVSDFVSQQENRFNDAVNLIYEEINKNYKYTEEQDREYNNRLSQNIDSKVNDLNQSVLKNASFLEAYIAESVGKLEYDTSNRLKNIIETVSDSVNSLTDSKIDKVYSEITNNYEFTKNLVSENKNEIIRSSEEQITELYKLIKDVSNSVSNIVIPDVDLILADKLKNLYEVFSLKLREIPADLSEENDKKLDNVYAEIRKNAEYLKNRLNEALSASTSDFAQNFDKIRDDLRTAVSDVQSKTTSDFIKIETQLNSELSVIRNDVIKNRSDLVSFIERIKSELILLSEKNLEQSDKKIAEQISLVRSQIEALGLSVSNKIAEINDNVAFFKKITEENFSDFEKKLQEAFCYTDEKFEFLNREISIKQSETFDVIGGLKEAFSQDCLNNKAETDEKIKNVESGLADTTRNLSEKIYSVALDFTKRTDELSGILEHKFSSDLLLLTQNADKKANSLQNNLLSKLDERTQDILAEHKKSEGEVYEFTNNNLKEIYESFNSANSGLKEYFEYKIEKLVSDISSLSDKTDSLGSELSSKADISLKNVIENFIEETVVNLKSSFDEKLARISDDFEAKLNA